MMKCRVSWWNLQMQQSTRCWGLGFRTIFANSRNGLKYRCAVRSGRCSKCEVLCLHRNNPMHNYQLGKGSSSEKEKKTIRSYYHQWAIPKPTRSSCWETEVKLFWCINRSVLCVAYDRVLHFWQHLEGKGRACISFWAEDFKSDVSKLVRVWRRVIKMTQRSRKYDLWRNDQKCYFCLV